MPYNTDLSLYKTPAATAEGPDVWVSPTLLVPLSDRVALATSRCRVPFPGDDRRSRASPPAPLATWALPLEKCLLRVLSAIQLRYLSLAAEL